MKTASSLVLGFVLACVNLMSIVAGFAVYAAFRPTSQLGVQVPVAVLLTVGLFPLVCRLFRRLAGAPVRHRTGSDYLAIYVFALLWGPAIFVPLHYATQGYLTSAGNLVGLAVFQVPTNALAVLFSSVVLRGKRELGHRGSEGR